MDGFVCLLYYLNIYEYNRKFSLYKLDILYAIFDNSMIQRQSVYKRIQIQRLLDEQSRLEGELNEL